MVSFEKFVTEAVDWAFATAIAAPISLVLTSAFFSSAEPKEALDFIREGMDRARVTPVESRPLTVEETFAYRP